MKKTIALFALVVSCLSLLGLVYAGGPNHAVKFSADYNFHRDPDVHRFRLIRDGESVVILDLHTDNCTTQPAANETLTTLTCTIPCSDYPKACITSPSKFTMTALDDAGQESKESDPYNADFEPWGSANVTVTIINKK